MGLIATLSFPLIPGSTVEYVREEINYEEIKAQVSAFTSAVDETDGSPTETASGSQTKSTTLACPDKLAFGTKVEIEGKVYTCEDRMNARYRKSEHYDIWMQSKELAREWGRRDLTIKVYK